MKIKTKKRLVVFFRYLTRLGLLRGLVVYAKLHIFKFEGRVETGFLKFPITLRKGTTDLATFDQVFISRIYQLPLKSVPETIVDCGANVGMASIYFANKFPAAKIISLEPESSNVEVLKKNCSQYPNIHVVNKAVWHTRGILKLVDSGTGNYGFAVEEMTGGTDPGKDGVEATTLSEIMREFALDRIDLLKIDIEGSEKELFTMNYDDWLSRTKSVAIEIHDRMKPGTSRAVIKAVAKYDFSASGTHEGFFFERMEE